MENLNKTQLILLAVLLSFVVSIATAIFTVALLEQAPAPVPQTINRVIKETIEKVSPTETKTIVVKEEDLVVDAIEKNKNSLVYIFKKGEGEPENLGLGFFVAKNLIITQNKNFEVTDSYFIKAPKEIEAKLLVNDKRGFSVFKVEGENIPYSNLADSSKLRPGQTLIFLGEKINRDTFSKFTKEELFSEEGQEPTSFDIINVVQKVEETPALVINLDGEVVGLTTVLNEKSIILPSNLIKEALPS